MLLHGWSLDRRVWQPQFGALTRRFRLVAIDRRGFGRSSAPPDLAAEVGDLLAVRDALDLDRMVVVGMSQGGRVALHFALAHPEHVAGLVLQGAPLDGFEPAPRGADLIPLTSYAALVRQSGLERMKALWRRHPLMQADGADARRLFDAMLADYQGRDLLAGAAHGLGPAVGDLEAVYAPALVITGEHDLPWRQLVGDALAYGLPHARRARIPGAGHLCNVGHAEAFNTLVADFVARIEAGTAGAAGEGARADCAV